MKGLILSGHTTRPEACNFIIKETLARLFSYEFCENSKNTFSKEHFWTTTNRTKSSDDVYDVI